MRECQIIDVAQLGSFSGIQRLSILLAVASVHCHQQPWGILFPPDSPVFIACRLVTLATVNVVI